MIDPQVPDSVVSVSGVVQYIKSTLENEPQLSQIWMSGEVSSLHHHRLGLFFTLSDQNEQASIKCVVWKSQQQHLWAIPKSGSQVIIQGKIRFYIKKGEIQLNVWQILPVGEGLQSLNLQKLRSRLEAEGLFAPSLKQRLPKYPQTIGVVTSPTAAAWGDIQKTIAQRNSSVSIILSPATVQGYEAPQSIFEALAKVNQDGRAELIILARGGGAVEDLYCFNDERVVRAIAQSSIPVVTGIGHQQDETLADLVADFAAHTPTAAAEVAIPDFSVMRSEHLARKERLKESMRRRLEQENQRISQFKQRLRMSPQTSVTFNQSVSKINLLKHKLTALDPQSVLKRGYALVQKEGQIVQEAKNLSQGEELTLNFADGEVIVKVIENRS